YHPQLDGAGRRVQSIRRPRAFSPRRIIFPIRANAGLSGDALHGQPVASVLTYLPHKYCSARIPFMHITFRALLIPVVFLSLVVATANADAPPAPQEIRHLLYVCVPGVRGDIKYGGTGILVFDIDHDHKFLRRIALPQLGDPAKPLPVKGVCASAETGRLYVSTPHALACLDLLTDKQIWQQTYNAG